MDETYVLDFASRLLGTGFPTGYTKKAIDLVADEAAALGYQTKRNNEGNLLIYVRGSSSEKTIGFCVYYDILGLMVHPIRSNGMLAVANIGDPIIPTLDGEYCRIHTRDGRVYGGTVPSYSPASYVYKDTPTRKCEVDEMEIRIDEVVETKADVEILGICNGGFVATDPKIQIMKSGFIKSRFLDDEIGVSALVGVLQHMKEHSITPACDLIFVMSTYKKVGRDMLHMPECISELIIVDMGYISLDPAYSEQDASVCTKDSSGLCNYEVISRLIELVKEKKLCYTVDIYPIYGSDISATLRGGCNVRDALIGSSVHASHGMERARYDGVKNTMKLTLTYIS